MGSTARRARPAVRGSGAGRGYVILPEGGLCKPAGVSRLAQRAISGALPISENVITVAVVTGDDSPAAGRDDELQEQWARRNPGRHRKCCTPNTPPWPGRSSRSPAGSATSAPGRSWC